MMPALSPLSAVASRRMTPQPMRFRAVAPPVTKVSISCGEYRRASGTSLAQKAGLRYEDAIQEWLQSKFGIAYWAAPKLHFMDASGMRTAIPDGILRLSRAWYIFEIKSQHMPDSWWQLRRLYQPVLEALKLNEVDPPHRVRCIELCRSFDPQVPFNEEPVLIDDLDAHVDRWSPPDDLGVFVWRPQR